MLMQGLSYGEVSLQPILSCHFPHFSLLGPKCVPKTIILDATIPFEYHIHANRYDHEGLLEDGCEKMEGGKVNFFVVDNEVYDAFIRLDIGCDVYIVNVQLKNTYNRGHYE